ncbi:MAG: efflux RND transporter periplasmic adaptor subunit, partial [Chthoniobacteraceae bacterium]
STVVFNANPLMRFDGYYIMMDLLEVPNLQAKSRALIQKHVNRLIFGSGVQKNDPMARMPLPKKRFWLFYTYAVLSWAYGYWVIYKLIIFMKPHLEPLGLEGLANWFSALALTSWVLLPFIGYFKKLELNSEDWRKGGRMRRLSVIGAIAIGIFGAACFFPVELKIKRRGIAEPAQPEHVRPQVAGFVDRIFVESGQLVKPGEPIATLTNREISQERIRVETRLRMAEAGIQRALGESKPAELKQAQIVKAAYQAKFDEAERDLRSLKLASHITGTVITRDLDLLEGQLIRSGELFCEIAPLDKIRVKIALNEKQVRHIERGQKVAIKTPAYPATVFYGTVADDPVMFFGNKVPPGFAQSRGGDVATYADGHGNEVPIERTFEAIVEVENPGGLLRPGMSVTSQITAGTHPWGRLLLQSVLDLLSLDYRFLF